MSRRRNALQAFVVGALFILILSLEARLVRAEPIGTTVDEIHAMTKENDPC